MVYQLDVNYPDVPDDTELIVAHLGVFHNGQVYDLSEEQVDHWEHETGQEWPEDGVLKVYDPDNFLITEDVVTQPPAEPFTPKPSLAEPVDTSVGHFVTESTNTNPQDSAPVGYSSPGPVSTPPVEDQKGGDE